MRNKAEPVRTGKSISTFLTLNAEAIKVWLSRLTETTLNHYFRPARQLESITRQVGFQKHYYCTALWL